MAPPAVVLPSPLLPTVAYDGLARALRQAGIEASVASAALDRHARAADLVHRWSELLDRDVLAVAHSNAGYLVPLARSASGTANPIVFMDAALPPAAGSYSLAPESLRQALNRLADETVVLPPWTRWWPAEDLADVIPPQSFDEIDRACPRLPLAYFDASMTAPDGWADGPNAYLAFGDTYEAETLFAERHGWPAVTMPGAHLHFLHAPREVADVIADLAERLGRSLPTSR